MAEPVGVTGNLQQPSINGGFNGKITYERKFIVARIIKLFFSICFNHYILAAIIFAITRRRLFRKIMSSVSKEQTSANFNQKHGVIPYKRTASNPFSYCNMPLRSRLRRARQILEGEQASLQCIWVWVSGLTPGVIKIWEIPKLNGDFLWETHRSNRFLSVFFAIFLRTKYEAYDVGRMVNKGNHPQMVNNYFRLVNYYGLFRLCI